MEQVEEEILQVLQGAKSSKKKEQQKVELQREILIKEPLYLKEV